MTIPAWHEEPIAKHHDRKAFDCGDAAMNEFLHRYARQSHDAGGAKIFLAINNADNTTVLGFYSLAPGALAYADTPEMVRRGLARLATQFQLQGKGLGGQLLTAAGRRCLRAAANGGGVTLIIDEKNHRAVNWYAAYGTMPLANTPLTLVMSLVTFATELKATGRR